MCQFVISYDEYRQLSSVFLYWPYPDALIDDSMFCTKDLLSFYK